MNKAQSRPTTLRSVTRVFLVDDHPVIRHGMAQLLGQESDIEIAGDASGALDAISGIQETMPDLLIMDLTLSDGVGIELIKDVRVRWPQIKILVVSMHNDPIYAERAMRAGALGYLTKDQPQEQILKAVRMVQKGKIYLCPDMSDTLLHRALQGEEGLQQSPIETLSDRELEVFELLGEGCRTRDIAERLSLSIKTIETYRDNIKTKLALSNSGELVHRAIRWKMEREG